MPAIARLSPRLLTVLAGLAGAGAAWAHGNEVHAGEAHSSAYPWTFDPVVVGPLAAFAVLAALGWMRLRQRARRGQTTLARRGLLLAGGLALLAAALVSPLHALGEALFTAHMIEHEIVMALAAPLIVLARPLAFVLWGLPRGLRLHLGRMLRARSAVTLWRALSGGAVATLLHGAVIWIWHLPVLFDAAVSVLFLHRLQHVSFLLTALLFWWAVLFGAERGVAAFHVFATMLHTSLLGALMALSRTVLYGEQTRAAPLFGMTPLEDQQLAGLLMWVPAGTVYAGAALWLLACWIARSGKEATHVPSPV